MMESVKKWLAERTVKRNGLYVHYSPPKLLDVVSSAQLRHWARGGANSKLERAVLTGQGRRLLAESLPLSSHLSALHVKCEALHRALENGSLLELQEILESDYNRKKFVACKDEAGVGLLHKAIYYGYMDIATYLVNNYPELVHQRDSEGRTPLHYAAASGAEAAAAALLERAGGARGARDAAGRTPATLRRQPALLALPRPAHHDMPPDKNNAGLVIKRHNIRIWCHDCDMGKLQRVVWEGHGARLLSEVSNQPVVKRFLEAVPYIMNTIREIHSAVIQNDLEGLLKLSGDPVPPQILSSRDGNNMTVMHKAAGLGHGGILNYIAERYPQGINDVDNEGRTPLHYAAAVRDDQHLYDTLVSLGADEGVVDNKNRTPGYYVNRPHEIDKNVFKTLPEAPRTPSSAYPPSWDWKILTTEAIVELNKKSRRKNHKASNENISSKNNSNSISENTNYRRGMKNSSTQELIRNLPELDDKKHNGNFNSNKDSEVVEDNGIEKDDEEKEHDDDVTEDNTEDEEKVIEEPAKPETQAEDEHENSQHEDDANEENQNTNDNEQNDDVKLENEEEEHEQEENDNEHKEEVDQPQQQEVEKETGEVVHDENDVQNEPANTEEEHTKKENQTHDEESHDEKQVNDVTNEEPNEDNQDDPSNDDSQKNEHENKEEDEHAATNEGNDSHEHNEDDDDVQVPGDSHSEYSDIHQRSTAEAIDTASSKRGNETDGRSSQESLIEGIINGEAEQDSQDASITQRDETVQGEILVVDSDIDPEVAELINTANMEMLATLVLNGEGSRLIGRRSGNVELQSFLNNVPIYMQKINKVHLAAREGNIKDLQAALDRRKFAIARDPISPNGATPLHVATIFGKTNIMKYLGGRFPETLSAVDFEGRTALHYAAVLPDNGHYYNVLQQLGANAKDLDDGGRSAEDYFKDPGSLTYTQLLADFGIDEEAAQSMLSDKGTTNNANGHMDIPIFKTDEGRYLAKCKILLKLFQFIYEMNSLRVKDNDLDDVFAALGDPLIKGLTEVANVKPKDPIAFLASFLQNFPDHEKPRLGTQETNLIVTQEEGEVENEAQAPPPVAVQVFQPVAMAPPAMAVRSAARSAPRPHRPIDVVTVDPQPEVSPDAPEVAFSSVNRDEHGQSVLHFAAARSHTRNSLFQMLQESDVSIGYRDELYRTARDISIQANVLENTSEIDRFVLHLAARGNTEKIMQLLLEGYDHILDVVDEEGVPITEVISKRGDSDMTNLLAAIASFEEQREALHGAVRRGDLRAVEASISAEGGRTLARGMNSFGRTALHVAVLAQHEDVVSHLAQHCPELLRIGDNLERTPLHYSMGVEKMESLSRILIRAGAKRVLKDLKGRQPSYYFMNKSDILRLKEEEEVY